MIHFLWKKKSSLDSGDIRVHIFWPWGNEGSKFLRNFLAVFHEGWLVKHQGVQPVGRNLCRIVEAMRILASFVGIHSWTPGMTSRHCKFLFETPFFWGGISSFAAIFIQKNQFFGNFKFSWMLTFDWHPSKLSLCFRRESLRRNGDHRGFQHWWFWVEQSSCVHHCFDREMQSN